MSETRTSIYSKSSAGRKTEKDVPTVAEVDIKKDEIIDYKNSQFNEVVYDIFLAREKVKNKIVEMPSPERSSVKKRRGTISKQ